MRLSWTIWPLAILDVYIGIVSAWSGRGSSLCRRTSSLPPGPSRGPWEKETPSLEAHSSDVLPSETSSRSSGQSKKNRSGKVIDLDSSPATSSKLRTQAATLMPPSSLTQQLPTQKENYLNERSSRQSSPKERSSRKRSPKKSSPGLFRTFAYPPPEYLRHGNTNAEETKAFKAARTVARLDRERARKNLQAAERKKKTGFAKPASQRMREAIRRGYVKNEAEWHARETERQEVGRQPARRPLTPVELNDNIRMDSPTPALRPNGPPLPAYQPRISPSAHQPSSPASAHPPDNLIPLHQDLYSLFHTGNAIRMAQSLHSYTMADAMQRSVPYLNQAQHIQTIVGQQNLITQAQALHSQAQAEIWQRMQNWSPPPDQQ